MTEQSQAAESEREAMRQELEFVAGLNKALMPYQERAVKAEAQREELEATLRRIRGYAEELERGIPFEGDAKVCARHVQREVDDALSQATKREDG